MVRFPDVGAFLPNTEPDAARREHLSRYSGRVLMIGAHTGSKVNDEALVAANRAAETLDDHAAFEENRLVVLTPMVPMTYTGRPSHLFKFSEDLQAILDKRYSTESVISDEPLRIARGQTMDAQGPAYRDIDNHLKRQEAMAKERGLDPEERLLQALVTCSAYIATTLKSTPQVPRSGINIFGALDGGGVYQLNVGRITNTNFWTPWHRWPARHQISERLGRKAAYGEETTNR